ncbi:MAG: DNRLRE domain-containing protein, partial [Phycicoccus sp.]|nr:DNRLRE domain-containing protein [Phycicoccus sp.]
LTAGGVSAVLALKLAVTAEVSQAAAAPVAAATAAAPKAAKVVSRPDLVSARVTARAQGSRVEAESERTGTSTTWVNPDGTLTTEQHAGPIRFHDAEGGCRFGHRRLPAPAVVAGPPRAPPGGLRLSGPSKTSSRAALSATENDVVSTDEGKGGTQGVSLAWSGKLGKPTLAGNRATYAEVQPGVDLAVDALRTGYEQFLIIKTPAALAALSGGGAVVSWSLPVKTRGLTSRAEADGSVSFVDAKNVVASRLAAPKAWDAGVDPRSGEHTSTAPVKLTVAQKGKGKAVITLTPDQGWLTDPARVFPITIDPTYASANVTTSFDTYVSKAYPTATYSTATELRVGTYNGGVDAVRSFLTFPLASIKGKQIQSASLSLYEFHSWSCTARVFYVYSAYGASSATNWSNQPAAPTSYGSLTTAKGYSSSCAAGRVSVPVTSLVAAWSGSTSTAGAIRLHASETDNYGWKKFYSLESTQDPYITFTYNRKPNAASAPTLQAPPATSFTPLGSTTPMLFTTDSTPQFSSKATDPDANTVAMTTEVHTSTTTTSSTLKASCATALVASGATGSCSPTTALADSTTYYARTAVKDQLGLWNGTWSPWTTFYTSWSTPPVPVIACPAPFTDGWWQDQPPTTDITCTVTAAGVPGNYATPGYIDLTVDGVAKARVKIVVSNDPNVAKTTVVVSKALPGGHTITAVSVARTLKVSAAKTYSFGWGGASLTAPKANPATSGKIIVAAAGPPRGTAAGVSAKLQWRVAGAGTETTGWTDGQVIDVPPVGATTSVTAPATSWDVRTLHEKDAPLDVPTRTPVLLDVQVCFAYTGVTTPQCTWSQSPISVTRVPHAFGGGYPTAAAGPGQVALFTGELNTSTTDVSVPGYAGDLALSRSHTSFDGDGTVAGWPKDPVTGVFGPGWTAALEGPEAGGAGMQVIDNTRLDGTIVLVDDQGSPLVYQNPAKTRLYTSTATTAVTYLAATTDTVDAASDLVLSGTGASMTMVLTEEDGTKTTWKPVAAPVGTADTDWRPFSVAEPGQTNATTYGHDPDTGRVTRIVAAVPDGMATALCPTSGALARGCRALEISYATANSPTFPGDYAGQVSSVSATLWDPASSTMTSTIVATYQYDASGRLVKASNPRTNLSTEYTWDGTSTRLASFKPTGLAASRLVYDLADPKLPKVSAVTRDGATAGGPAVTMSRFVYGVPTAGAGLPDVSTAGVAPWAQAKVPVTGYAVFGADYTGPVTGAGVDWSYADLQYADDQGYTVNAASFGAGAWQVSATDYDAKGNQVREFDAGAIADVLAAAGSLDAGQVDALSTQTIYTADIKDAAGVVVTPAGTLVTDTYGPVRTATLAGGTDLPVRPHTHTDYDQNAPSATNPANGEPWRLPTTITTFASDGSAAPNGTGDIETLSTSVNSYTAVVAGDGDGWVLGTPTRVTTGGIAAVSRFDAAGRTIETRQPLSTGTGAGTTKTVYYTAGPNTADPGCGNRPEWAGLGCRTYPAGAPSSGPTLPDQRTTGYSMWLQAEQAVETSGTATRTTETRYDPAGRPVSSWTTSTIPGSTARPGTFTHYRADNGLVDYTGTLNATKTGADPAARTSSTYDLWGRQLTYTSDLGEIATTTYDAAGRVGSVADAKGTTTYGYDGTDAAGKSERRGLATSLTITRAGTAGTLVFSGAYDGDGKLVTQKLPGAITATNSYDEAGEPAGLAYSGQVTPVTQSTDPDTFEVTYIPGTPLADQPWLAWSQTNDATGRVRRETTGVGAAFDGVPGVTDPADITAPAVGAAISSDREYTYDPAGRLTRVGDRTATGYAASGQGAMPCKVRDYTFNNNGNRTELKTTTHPDGDCASTTGTTTTTLGYDYDDADRPTTAAKIDGAAATGTYTYDDFGRQTTLPADDAPDPTKGNITLAYYDSDLPQAITAGGTTTSYTLSVNDRRQTATTGPTGGPATSTSIRHYADSSDNPAWIETTTTGLGGATSTARYAGSLGGDLGATIAGDGTATLPLANLHGDILTNITIPPTQAGSTPAAGIDGWSDYTEYGSPRDTAATTTVAGAAGYGWLGAKERSTTAQSAGLTLMGDRLYNAVTGRFTSLDPEPGGNPTAYTYPLDPINMFDLDGHWPGWAKKAWGWAGQHKVDIALTALSFVPGLGAAAWAVRGYRAYRAYRGYQAVQKVRKAASVAGEFIRNGNNVFRMGHAGPNNKFRIAIGPQRDHWNKMGHVRQSLSRAHVHIEKRYGGVDWHRRSGKSRNWTWWPR